MAEGMPVARSWRSVLPELRGGAAAVDACGPAGCSEGTRRYLQRGLTDREAAAKRELQQQLVEKELWVVVVEGFHGSAFHANGVYLRLVSGEAEQMPNRFKHQTEDIYVYRRDGSPPTWVVATSLDASETTGVLAEVGGLAEAREGQPWRDLPMGRRWQARSRDHALARDGSVSVKLQGVRVLSNFLTPAMGAEMSKKFQEAAVMQLWEFPSLLEGLMHKHGLSVLELQKCLLPGWPLDISFPNRASCVAALGVPQEAPQPGSAARPSRAYVGEGALPADAPAALEGHPPMRGVRWVELLDGSVHARLMSSVPMSMQRANQQPLADIAMVGACLRALRQVLQRWTAAIHPSFPAAQRRHMEALLDLGECLGFGRSMWETSVLPFLTVELSDWPAWSRGSHMWKLGRRVEMTSRDGERTSCLVTKVEPTTGAMEIDADCGTWLLRSVREGP